MGRVAAHIASTPALAATALLLAASASAQDAPAPDRARDDARVSDDSPAAADVRAPDDIPAPDDVLRRADSLYFRFRPEEALNLLEPLVATADGNREASEPREAGVGPGAGGAEALWRAARAASAVGLFEPDLGARNEWLARGAEYGRRAVRADSAGVEGRYWLVVNAGLLALKAPSAEEIVALARETRKVAESILADDEDHGGAHGVLGRMDMEIMMLPRWKRWLARLTGAGDLMAASSWEGARSHLERAVEVDPDFILHHLDLARLHMERDRTRAAREHLRRVLALQPLHPPDLKFQLQAERLLEQIEAEAVAN